MKFENKNKEKLMKQKADSLKTSIKSRTSNKSD